MWEKWKLGLPTKAEKTFPSFQKVEVVIMDMIASILLFCFPKGGLQENQQKEKPKRQDQTLWGFPAGWDGATLPSIDKYGLQFKNESTSLRPQLPEDLWGSRMGTYSLQI